MLKGTVSLYSALYKDEWEDFIAGSGKYRHETSYAEKEFRIAEKLFNEGVIAPAGYEKAKYTYNSCKATEAQFVSGKINSWQEQKSELIIRLDQYKAEYISAGTERSYAFMLAPSDGTLINCTGIKEGNQLYAGQQLAELSTKENLIAECYISPKDIGYLHTGMQVKLQIDAYNYREWGSLTGIVSEIGNDIIIVNSQPVYRLRINPEEESLSLNNHTQGKIRKGMTLTAHININRRTVIQLLFDKADNWFNPANNN